MQLNSSDVSELTPRRQIGFKEFCDVAVTPCHTLFAFIDSKVIIHRRHQFQSDRPTSTNTLFGGSKLAIPRSKLINSKEVGTYHCISRCVRRSFLCGNDYYTGKDFKHRRAWIETWIASLADVLLVDVCSFAVMSNHVHLELTNRPDLLEELSDQEIAERLARLYPGFRCYRHLPPSASPERVQYFLDHPNEIYEKKDRLASISIFMAVWQESVARCANKEEDKTGRFWEGRYKCRRLEDNGAKLMCSIYIDLNPYRAGEVRSPEESQFTSLGKRIHDIKRESRSLPPQHDWLAPLKTLAGDNADEAFLPVNTHQYLELVDYISRRHRTKDTCELPDHLEPILNRLGLKKNSLRMTVSRFNKLFKLVVGSPNNMGNRAKLNKQNWHQGISASRTAYED